MAECYRLIVDFSQFFYESSNSFFPNTLLSTLIISFKCFTRSTRETIKREKLTLNNSRIEQLNKSWQAFCFTVSLIDNDRIVVTIPIEWDYQREMPANKICLNNV